MNRILIHFLLVGFLVGVASCIKYDPEDPTVKQILTANTWKLYEIDDGTTSNYLLDTEWKFDNDSTLLIVFPSGGSMQATWQNTEEQRIRIGLPSKLPDGTTTWRFIYADIAAVNINRLELREISGSLNGGSYITYYKFIRKV